jgi:hypothetical protein
LKELDDYATGIGLTTGYQNHDDRAPAPAHSSLICAITARSLASSAVVIRLVLEGGLALGASQAPVTGAEV